MTRYHGGDQVRGGFYWNGAKWDATFVSGETGVLPGEPAERYRRVPILLVLLAAPLMGALFVIFLPFIGIAIMLQQMTRASLELAGNLLERTQAAVSPASRIGGGRRPSAKGRGPRADG